MSSAANYFVNSAMICVMIFVYVITSCTCNDSSSSASASHPWDFWWAYDGISGPDYWGVINPEWSLCSKGKRQSPIDIQPDQLLFDPTLEPLHISGNLINGTVTNTGRGLLVQVNQSFMPLIDPSIGNPSQVKYKQPHSPPSTADDVSATSLPSSKQHQIISSNSNSNKVIISKGPLSYNYTLDHIVIHYGSDSSHGSEHLIDGHSFPIEVQMYSFNSQLYSSWKEAESRPNGIAAIAILGLIANGDTASKTNSQMKIIAEAAKASSLKGGQAEFVTGVSMVNLLPSNTLHYLTYEGSLTQPSCYENVNWIILNKPIYITNYDLNVIKNSINGYGDNFRPVQPIARRCIRTNIDLTISFSPASDTSASTSSISIANTKQSESKLSGGKTCSTTRFATYKSLARLSSSSPSSIVT